MENASGPESSKKDGLRAHSTYGLEPRLRLMRRFIEGRSKHETGSSVFASAETKDGERAG